MERLSGNEKLASKITGRRMWTIGEILSTFFISGI